MSLSAQKNKLDKICKKKIFEANCKEINSRIQKGKNKN